MKEEVIRGNHKELMSYRNLSIKMLDEVFDAGTVFKT